MEALGALSLSSFHLTIPSKTLPRNQIEQSPLLNPPLTQRPSSCFSSFHTNNPKFKLQTAIYPAVSTELTDPPEQELEIQNQDEKFDWFSHWYPIMPVCDLDKRAPHGKKVLGLDIVVWWDRNESAWKVFDDACPHRLAPLSQGRIDQWGRLQCVYHGWCFGGAGDCKLIPQAPRDGPPIHTSKKACVAVYPSTVQNDIVWFWPNTDPKYEDILLKKKPPYIPELDDPSYAGLMGNRDIQYGYEVLIENLMDPAHVPYAHYGIMGSQTVDREGGRPLEISIDKLDINGYTAKQENIGFNFIAPCVLYGDATVKGKQGEGSASAAGTTEERKIMDVGPSNWQKSCFVPTKSDALVVAFRWWLNENAAGQIDWRPKFGRDPHLQKNSCWTGIGPT